MKKEKMQQNLKNCSLRDNEDLPVIKFLDTLDKNKSYSLLEVGSGLCRFVNKIKLLYPNIEITCYEINKDLANKAQEYGFNTINDNFLNNTIEENKYDIVHCSHVIEHFKYPEITFVIDELLRITKTGGSCIIRSPLMWKDFFNDIDHVRIYPPDAIIAYLRNEQQQKKGKNEVCIMNIWYRTLPKQYLLIDKSFLIYGIPFIRTFLNRYIIPKINHKFVKLWNKYRYPASKPNGYVMIVKKESE